jgi:hypothetical protein
MPVAAPAVAIGRSTPLLDALETTFHAPVIKMLFERIPDRNSREDRLIEMFDNIQGEL